MDLLPIAFFLSILFSFGLGVYAFVVSARAPSQGKRAELRRVTQLAAVHLLEPGLSVGAFLGLSRLTEPPFNLFPSSNWGGLGVGIVGFGLVLLQLMPLAFKSWTIPIAREMAGGLTRFGLWRTGLSASVLVFILWSGKGGFADSGLELENQSVLEQILPWMVLMCFLASIAVFLYALAHLFHILTQVWGALQPTHTALLEE